jgi:antitoxin Phd
MRQTKWQMQAAKAQLRE